MKNTWMSVIAWTAGGLTLTAVLSGCASSGGGCCGGSCAKNPASPDAATLASQAYSAPSAVAQGAPQFAGPQSAAPPPSPAYAGEMYGVNPVSTALAAPASFVSSGFPSSASPGSGCSDGNCCRGGLSTPTSVNTNAATLVTQTNGASNPTPTAGQYGGQKTCPVTGQPLGSMGAPVPVTVNGQTIYLCCEGCVAKFNQYTDACLALVESERHPERSSSSGSSMSCSSCSKGGGGCASCRR